MDGLWAWEKDEETRIILSRDFAQLVSNAATKNNKFDRKINRYEKKRCITFRHVY